MVCAIRQSYFKLAFRLFETVPLPENKRTNRPKPRFRAYEIHYLTELLALNIWRRALPKQSILKNMLSQKQLIAQKEPLIY